MKRLVQQLTDRGDVILAAFLFALGAFTSRLSAPARVVELTGILLVAGRRRAPFACVVLAGILSAVEVPLAGPDQASSASVAGVAAILILNYSVAAYSRSLARSVAGGGIMLAASSLDLLLYGLGSDDFWVFRILFLVSTWAAGRALHARRSEVHSLETETQRLAREQEQHAAAAVADERSRLARELHDVIAHNVSMIGVQAAAAEHVLGERPDKARESLRNIQDAARQTIDELRRLLGVLRRTPDSEVAPQPSLDDVGALVDQFRQTGLKVDLSVEGSPRKLPASIELSGFRILQEALTNGLKHAGGAHLFVTMRYGREVLEIGVENERNGSAEKGRAGYGLLGMRERVEALGGMLEAGPRPGGGFALKAVLPLRPPAT